MCYDDFLIIWYLVKDSTLLCLAEVGVKDELSLLWPGNLNTGTAVRASYMALKVKKVHPCGPSFSQASWYAHIGF